MAKLVILTQGMAGRSHELKVDRTTIGRVDDNSFPIVEASVSSHHCEVLLRGNEVVIRDLNSTNGTFINGEKITESVLKPGQTLRLGQVELRLEAEGAPSTAPAPAPSGAAPAPASSKKAESTVLMQQGVKLAELETGATRSLETVGKGFSKKTNKGNKIFLIAAIVVGVIIVALVLVALLSASSPAPE